MPKTSTNFSQILNEPFQNGPSFVMVCQSGEISPNLVTLVEKQYPIFTEKRKLRFGLQNERRNKKPEEGSIPGSAVTRIQNKFSFKVKNEFLFCDLEKAFSISSLLKVINA